MKTTTTYSYTIIGPPGSTYTIANGINDKGQVVGFYQGSDGQDHSFVYSGGTYTTIDPSANSFGSFAKGINDKGQIVGFYEDSTNPGSLASQAPAPKVGLGVDTFVFAPNSGHDTNTLLDAIQHPQAELANLQHAAADTVSTHGAHDAITPLTDLHASNLHAGAFHVM